MSNEHLHPVGMADAVQYTNLVRKNAHTRTTTPNSLHVFREYDAMHPDADGYVISLPPLRTTTFPSIVVITNPELATKTAQQQDFSALSMDTIAIRGLDSFRGTFILGQQNKTEWQADRKMVTPAYSAHAIEQKRQMVANMAEAAVHRLFSTYDSNRLPQHWMKYLALDQITAHVIGAQLPTENLYRAANEHRQFVRHTSFLLLVGMMPDSIRKSIPHMVMPAYMNMLHSMNDTYTNVQTDGFLHHVLEQNPDREEEAADMIATLVSGVNFIPTQLNFTAYNLANHPELQEEARLDPNLLKRCIWETNRRYPAVPYTGRRAVKDLTIGNCEVKNGSLVILAVAAFGGEKNTAQADIFNPHREGLKDMATRPTGEAYIFGNGLHSCPAKHFAPEVTQATIQSLLNSWKLELLGEDTRINPVLGGASLHTKQAIPLRLRNRENPDMIIDAPLVW